MRAWLVKVRGKSAHDFDPQDRRIPMRALCGYKAWPQELIGAASAGMCQDRSYRMRDPIYCEKCKTLEDEIGGPHA